MCCTRLAENTGRKNYAKNRHLGTIVQFCLALSSQLGHVSTIGKKMLNGNICSICRHNITNFGPLNVTNGWDLLVSLRHLSKFQRVSRIGFVTAPTSLSGGQPNLARCLAVSWACTVYVHFQGFCPLTAVVASQTLRHPAEGATYNRHGGHHVGHQRTFLVVFLVLFFIFIACSFNLVHRQTFVGF